MQRSVALAKKRCNRDRIKRSAGHFLLTHLFAGRASITVSNAVPSSPTTITTLTTRIMSARAQPTPMSRSHAQAQASPRPRQPYSPRCPSPLGLPPTGPPPLAPHMAFTGYSYYPATPDRPVQPKGPTESRVAFPPEARRPLAGAQRPRSQPPPPLSLNDPQHPPTQLPRTAHPNAGEQAVAQRRSQSPTPSETSSLSLYSAESVHKNFPVNVANHDQQGQEEDEKPPSIFCGCFNFRALFGSKPKPNKILAPPARAPASVPQMVQTRRRPTPLNL